MSTEYWNFSLALQFWFSWQSQYAHTAKTVEKKLLLIYFQTLFDFCCTSWLGDPVLWICNIFAKLLCRMINIQINCKQQWAVDAAWRLWLFFISQHKLAGVVLPRYFLTNPFKISWINFTVSELRSLSDSSNKLFCSNYSGNDDDDG